MSDVELLYGLIQTGSEEQERKRHLRSLWERLSSDAQSSTTLALGLRQPGNDVRRLVLDAIVAHPTASKTRRNLVLPIVDVLRLNVQASKTSLSAIRTASSALKALSLILKEDLDAPLSAFDIQSILEAVLCTMAWGLPLALRPPARPSTTNARRSSPGSALAFDRRGSHSSNWRSAGAQVHSPIAPIINPSLQKKGSSASLNSNLSVASTSYTAEFETDQSALSDEDADQDTNVDVDIKQRRAREAKRVVRQRSITCLSYLNDGNGKALLLHWPRMILDADTGAMAASLMDVAERDESISNRVSALHAIQAVIFHGSQAGFLAGAEEGSRLSAFTSLSSRMASIIVDLRRRLLSILADPTSPPTLVEATLKCARILVLSTPKVKLRLSHSQVLREATLKLCSRPEVTSAVPAYSLLSVLVANERQGGDESTVDGLLVTLQNPDTPMQVRVEAWNTMTALAEKDAIQSGEGRRIGPLLHLTLSRHCDLEVRQAIANFVQACTSKMSIDVDAAIVEQLCRDDSPIVRSIAANCLTRDLQQQEQLITLMQDIDSTVRASAVRAAGQKMEASGWAKLAEQHITRLVHDDSLLVRMRASWTLGNLCEVSEEYARLLSLCLSLQGDDERVVVNAVRGLGALLSRSPTEVLEESLSTVESVLAWLLSVLASGPPKVRWNVAASLVRSLEMPSTARLLLSLLNSRLLQVLLKVIVEDNAFKVRLSAVNALAIMVERSYFEDAQGLAQARQAVHEALEKVEGQLKQASFKEAQLHALPLQQSLQKLSLALQSEPQSS